MLVKVDAKADTASRREFGIAGLPTVVFVDAAGKEVDRTLGFVATGEFIETIEGYEKGIGTLASLLAEEPSRSKDPTFLYKLATKLLAHNRIDDSDARLAAVIEIDPQNAGGDADDALLDRAGVKRKHKDWAGAVAHCRDLMRRWPESDLADDALVSIGFFASSGGMEDEAMSAYREYLSRWPDGEDAEFVTRELKELEGETPN